MSSAATYDLRPRYFVKTILFSSAHMIFLVSISINVGRFAIRNAPCSRFPARSV